MVNKSSIIKLKKYSSSGEFVLLPSQNYNNSPFDEYFLMEYLTPTGLNQKDYYSSYYVDNSLQGYFKNGVRISNVDN